MKFLWAVSGSTRRAKSGIIGQNDGWSFARDALAQRQIKGLEKRLLRAELALSQVATQPGQDASALQEKVDEILKRHRVAEYLLSTINKKISYGQVYEGPGRPSPSRRSRRVRQTTLTLTYQRCPEAMATPPQAGRFV